MQRIVEIFRRPAARFLLCGAAAAAINWLARFPLSLFLPFWLAVAVALVIGMSTGFHLYRRFVWANSNAPLAQVAWRFVAVNLVNAAAVLAMSNIALAALMSAAVAAPLAQAGAHALGILAGAALNYWGHSRFTFARAA